MSMTIKKDELSREFIKVLEKHIGIVVKISRAYARTFHDREDLVNDIMLQLWKSFKTFNGDSKFSTWMYRVSLNTSLNYHHKKQMEVLIFTDDLLEIDIRNIISSSQAELEKYDILYKCIEELENVNKVIVLLYLDEQLVSNKIIMLFFFKSISVLVKDGVFKCKKLKIGH